jgi:PAS domain S-box-containing protein
MEFAMDNVARRPLRLLIVEDSRLDAELACLTLQAAGFDVESKVVDNGPAMRAALLSQDWDLVVSDHSMPQFSGSEALELVLELRPDTPFIIVSGEIDLDQAVSLMKSGARNYIPKLQLNRLPSAVERALFDMRLNRAQKDASQKLAASERRYRRLFETAQDGILIVDAISGEIQDVNPFLLDLLGFSKEEYLDKKLWEVAAFRDSEASKSAFLELQNNGYIRYDNIPLHDSQGGDVEVEFVSNVYTVGDKKVIQCNIREISARRAVEAEMVSDKAELERRVRLRTAQVDALNRELQTFNYSVSHDLRAPLRRITGFVTALERVCGAEISARGKDLMQEIKNASAQMTTLITALLKLSSFSGVELMVQPTDLSSMAHEVAAQLQQSEPQRKVEIVIAEGLSDIADPSLTRVVLENLMRNAWKFSSKQESARIEVGISQERDKPAAFFVQDNGVGFDMKYADKLFGAFQRLHSEDEFPGTGIGLATVQRIINRHGGKVWAESQVGKGARFSFTLGAVAAVGGLEKPSLPLSSRQPTLEINVQNPGLEFLQGKSRSQPARGVQGPRT